MPKKLISNRAKEIPHSGPSYIPVPAEIKWATFENKAYHYSIDYPDHLNVNTQNDYATDITQEQQVGFVGDGITYFSIALPSYDGFPEEYAAVASAQSKGLKAYVEAVRDIQVNDKNPHVQNKQVGGLEETTIDNRPAYKFTLTGTFAFESEKGLGYALIPGKIYVYTYTTSPLGQIVELSHTQDDPRAGRMVSSLHFSN